MKIYTLLFLLFALSFASCAPKPAIESQTATYDANSPAVSSSPTPTTSSTLPPTPGSMNAPQTYGSPGMTPRSVEAAPTTYGSVAAVAAPVIGSWVNTTDPDETVVFTDHSYLTYYNSELIVEEEMTYHIQCPTDCSGGVASGIPCFTIASQYEKDCFGIVRVTENELELIMLGMSTETVKYVRKMP